VGFGEIRMSIKVLDTLSLEMGQFPLPMKLSWPVTICQIEYGRSYVNAGHDYVFEITGCFLPGLLFHEKI
jgi:hypothetical protein